MFRAIRDFAKDIIVLLWAPVGSALLSIGFWATFLVSVYLAAVYNVAVVIGWALVVRRNWPHNQGIKTGEYIGWDRQMQALKELFGGEKKRARRTLLSSIRSSLRALF